MGSGHASCCNALNSLYGARVQPDVLGPLCWGWVLCVCVASILGSIGLATRWPSGTDFGAHAPHSVGVRPLLRCPHHLKLEILLCPAYHFLSFNYGVFVCRSMAFTEANRLTITLLFSHNRFVFKKRNDDALLVASLINRPYHPSRFQNGKTLGCCQATPSPGGFCP